MLDTQINVPHGREAGKANEGHERIGGACLYCVAQIQPLAKSSTKCNRDWNSTSDSKLTDDDDDDDDDTNFVSQEIKLQSELTSAQYTISMLRKKIAELNKRSLNMIPLKVHEEMIQKSDDRALRAERKVSVLEQEVKKLRAQLKNQTPAPICTSSTMPPICESPSEGYEEPHRSRRDEIYKPHHVNTRFQAVGVMPSVTTPSTREPTKKASDHPKIRKDHTNDLGRHGTTGKHTLVLANGHTNIPGREQPPPRTLPTTNFARGVSVMPSVVPQPVISSVTTVKSATKNSHFEEYPEMHVFSGSKTLGRNASQSAKTFRKNIGTVHYTAATSKLERLAGQPKARRRPSVHSLVTQSIVNLDDQRERELMEDAERREAEEKERLERERVAILNNENKATKQTGKFRKTTKASKFFLSRKHTSKPKSGTQKSLLSRMHTKFFTSRRKSLRHIYDLPEVSSLESCSLTSDYETPSQKMQNFAATPLIFGHDHESEDSDWSSSEDGVTSRLNKARQERRSAGKSRDRHKPKQKATPPPIAPKPKKRNNPSPSGSSNPPSSPDTTSPDTTPEISFDDIVVEPPQLKIYKRIQGPPGRRKPQRFSNQSEVRQSELQRESDLWR
ncbi:uncharacterized protein LOC121405811 isoform X2 [Lytechinus variegatus]|uniref:uncharacterized protein LOC121405811 isoform X2 n=1 Tax=Lytechinus variegatus TaxID=7654 RepID=UPI001BB2AED3|nr:uncharacterized protein LOC121405811 isoform X2 [Lytechinus variegatus]